MFPERAAPTLMKTRLRIHERERRARLILRDIRPRLYGAGGSCTPSNAIDVPFGQAMSRSSAFCFQLRMHVLVEGDAGSATSFSSPPLSSRWTERDQCTSIDLYTCVNMISIREYPGTSQGNMTSGPSLPILSLTMLIIVRFHAAL